MHFDIQTHLYNALIFDPENFPTIWLLTAILVKDEAKIEMSVSVEDEMAPQSPVMEMSENVQNEIISDEELTLYWVLIFIS